MINKIIKKIISEWRILMKLIFHLTKGIISSQRYIKMYKKKRCPTHGRSFTITGRYNK